MDYENVKMRLATLPGAYVSAELARYPEAVAMFLGSYAGARGESVVAVDITRVPEAGVPGVLIKIAVIPPWARTASAEVLPPEYGSRETPRAMAA